MFAPSYAPYILAHQRDAPSARDRYVSALSRARQAEVEYAAYLAQQARERAELVRRQRDERARAAAVKRLQMFILHATVSSMLKAQDELQKNDAPHAVAQREVPKPTPSPNNAPQLQRRNRVRPARAQDAPLDTPVSAVRTALKRRLASEPSVEVHATIHRILSNLPPSPTPVAAGPTPATPKSLASVQRLERAFRALASEFVFPPHLDFSPTTPAAEYPASKLPYTPRNAPVRHYEHALNNLLAQLDSVDSQGDAAVRKQRKLVVGMVEAALGELDRVVEGRWKLQDTRKEPRAAGAPNNVSPVGPANLPTTAASSSEDQLPSELNTTSIPVSDGTEPQLEPSQLPLEVNEVPAPADESFQLPPPLSADDASSITPVTVGVPELPIVVETAAPSDAESVAAPETLFPKSLSLVTALPDEEPVLIERDDGDSTSSWSEIED